MNDDLTLAGQRIEQAGDAIRRFCGLPWSGGPPETWAYPYYDATMSPEGLLRLTDVTAAAALHPGLSRADLGFFHERMAELQEWLGAIPSGVGLIDADPATLRHLIGMTDLADGVSMALLTKVLHRCRPNLIPLVDRHMLDRYRPITGERGSIAAWPAFLDALIGDLNRPENRSALGTIRNKLDAALPTRSPSDIRLIDIAIWMAGR
jgi:hypothetical protein